MVSRNRGGAYILAELDGAVMDRPIAAHRVKPYFGRTTPVNVSDADLDVPASRIAEMTDTVEDGEHDAGSGAFAWWDEQDE